MTRGPAPTAPCGTLAAYRRHRRHGEQACGPCLAAAREAKAGDRAGIMIADLRPVRNGLPDVPFYTWRARRYPWAERVLAHAQAVYGSEQAS